MRVTNQLLLTDFLAGMNKNRVELAKINEQISSQKTVNLPSDSPSKYSNSKEMEARVRRNEMYQRNAEAGIEDARMAGDAIYQMLDQLKDLKRLTVMGANNTYDQGGLDIIAGQVAGIRSTLVQLGNTQHQGRYLFGGTATQTLAFSESNGVVSYGGNSEDLQMGISESTVLKTSISGSSLFDMYGTDDVFSMLDRIESALRSGDTNTVNAEIANVDLATESISAKSAELGTNINRMEFAYIEYENSITNLKSNISRLVDTDYAEAISRFQNLETAYQASMSVGSRLLRLSLLNYL